MRQGQGGAMGVSLPLSVAAVAIFARFLPFGSHLLEGKGCSPQPPTPMDSLDFMKYTRIRGEPGGAEGSGETTAIFLFQEIE